MAKASLEKKVTNGSIILIVLMFMIVLAANYLYARHQARIAHQQQLTQKLNLLCQSLQGPLWSYDNDTGLLIGDAFMAGTDVVGLKIYSQITDKPFYSRQKTTDADVIYGQQNIVHDSRKVGQIEIGISNASYANSLSQLSKFSVILAFFIVLSLTLVMKIWFRRHLVDPLGLIGNWTDRLASGDYNADPPQIELAELDSVVNKFSNMSNKIRQRKKNLLESERKFRRLFENTEVSIWNEDLSDVQAALDKLRQQGVTDLRQYLLEDTDRALAMAGLIRIVQVNDATLALFSAQSQAQLISGIAQTFVPETVKVFIDELCAIWEKKTSFRSEIKLRALDGREIDAIISFPIPEVLEDFRSVPISIVDITGEKTAERALLEMDQMKNDFISSAAHELNTPLSSILGFTELLRDPDSYGGFSDEQKRDYLEEIYQRGESLNRIVDDLLDISRTQSGHSVVLQMSPEQIKDALTKAVNLYQIHYSSHPIRADFSDCPENLTLNIDRFRITQVLDNLLSNAVKYSSKGSEIVIGIRPVKTGCAIWVQDHGIGMSAEQVDKIFDKFYRADRANTAVGGLGLGMSIARKIVEDHGGTITVESRPGSGTTVTFTLPNTFAKEGTTSDLNR